MTSGDTVAFEHHRFRSIRLSSLLAQFMSSCARLMNELITPVTFEAFPSNAIQIYMVVVIKWPASE